MLLKKFCFCAPVILGILFVGCTKEVEENHIPQVEAGNSQIITDEENDIVLSGSASDQDGKVVAYLWSQVEGPSNSSISQPGSPTTPLKDLVNGKYLFQLMAIDDKGATGVDTVSIVVNIPRKKFFMAQPANNPTEFLISILNGADASGPTGVSLEADTWTNGGALWILRGLVKFDLGSIPANAIVKKATLKLFSNPTPVSGNLINANFGNNNAMLVQQVTSAWSVSNVGWQNQPATQTNNQIVIPATNESLLDLQVDVTNMVASMINNNTNYGFMIRLQNEVTLNSRIFVGSRNPTYPEKYPRIEIEYE
jgi:hypothetical protein